MFEWPPKAGFICAAQKASAPNRQKGHKKLIKMATENKPFSLTGDSFPKIIVRHDIRKRWYDDNGVLNIGVIDFLLDSSIV